MFITDNTLGDIHRNGIIESNGLQVLDCWFIDSYWPVTFQEVSTNLRPYHPEHAQPPLIPEANQVGPGLVLGWEKFPQIYTVQKIYTMFSFVTMDITF